MIQNIRDTIQSAAAWSNYDAAAVAVALGGPFTDDYNQLNQCYQCHGAPDNKVYVNTRWPAVCFDVDNEVVYLKTDLHINNDVWTPASSPVPPIDPVFDNLTHYWSLDEASGTRLDSKGSVNLSENNGAVASTTGIDNLAADFSGAASLSLANFGGSLSSMNYPFSISFWCWAANTIPASGRTTLEIGTPPGAGGVVFMDLANTGKIRAIVGADSDNIPEVTLGANSTWHLVVLSCADANNVKLSIDGSEFTVGTSNNGDLSGNDGNIEIAGDASGFPGLIDEIALYGVALTQDNVTTLWNGGTGKFYRP